MTDSPTFGVNWGVTRRHLLGEQDPERGRYSSPTFRPLCGGALTIYDPALPTTPKYVRTATANKGLDNLPLCKHCAKKLENT